jgi:hypothetical protein
VQALCDDIYAMRLAGELKLEEKLYWTLIRIYRNPAVMLEFTKRGPDDVTTYPHPLEFSDIQRG